MMKILLLSDTHSYIDDRILSHAEKADEVWHAGDIGKVEVTDQIKQVSQLRAVYGNIDGEEIRREFPLHQKFNCDGIKVWMTHIGGYPKRYVPSIHEALQQQPPDLFISGHSHILKVMRDQNLKLMHMNPGAAGVHGFHKERTMLSFEICEAKLKNLQLIKLGLRGKTSL
ncbi:metallophosphoesterase family protein [Psychroflexus sp. ALD_RP9]|uniref:metallophosphoesterase family protein n=1 Tax=Psychroflexus sp. ALD_RP9 TaxID=2777186 RepID=UPI001A8D6F98|nr:metallophosphoesterase family protein [Psychroflexus sp. ALD_RP9]QSS96972.1 metallophosphoesterase family protein [Psychroflexus sp. ALD_RP9]